MINKMKGTVILIEDELSDLQRIKSLLHKDYECLCSTNGTAGIALYLSEAEKNPLVISDVNLPDMMGFDVCRAIKSHNPATYVMLLTAYNNSKLRLAGFKAYADSYMDKTLSDEEIVLKVRNAFNTIQINQPVRPPTTKTQAPCKLDKFEPLVKKLLTDYYKKPIYERDQNSCNLEAMSLFFHLSPRTFQRKMHDQIGIPFKTYQLQVRLQMGKKLLLDDFNATQIAEILEFSSPSHFSRAFRDLYGVTPSKYKMHNLD